MIDIIKTGQAVRSHLFRDTVYDINGFLIEFEYNFENYYSYYAIENFLKNDQERAQNNASSGYWLKNEFDKYLRKEIDYVQLTDPNNGNEFNLFELAKEGESIVVEALSIGGDFYDRYYQQKKYSFSLENDPSTSVVKLYDKNNDGIIDGLDAIPDENVTTEFIPLENSTGGKFYRNNFYLKTVALPDNAYKRTLARYATLIGFKIHSIEHEVFPKLIQNESPGSQILTFVNQLQNSWQNNDVIGSLEISEFLHYYNSLCNFYANTYFRTFEGITGDKKLMYLMQVLPPSAISLIQINLRIKILEQMVNGQLNTSTEFIDLIFFPINPIVFTGSDKGDEILALKIIQSVMPSEANYFLTQLNNKKPDGVKSLFVMLYEKIDDKYLKYFGDENKGKFVEKLFRLWFISDFNPNNIYDFGSNTENTDTLYNSFNNNAVSLYYKSNKVIFGFYLDNMTFSFENNKIKVVQEVVESTYDEEEYEWTVKFIDKTVGVYNPMQAISFRSYQEQELPIAIPSISIENNESALLPLFYLKYIDDYADRQDLFTGIGLLTDIALTFTGIGNISKLRYLRHITKLGRLAIGKTVPAGERILALEALSGVSGLVELTSSVASLLLSYYQQGCVNYINAVNNTIDDTNTDGAIPDPESGKEWCKNLDQFLFWVQMASMSTDAVANVMVRNSARKLIAGTVPNDFPPDAYDVILRYAGNLAEMKPVFIAKVENALELPNSRLINDFENLLSENEQYEFLLHYGKAKPEDIRKLYKGTSQPSLVQEWKEIIYLKNQRRIPEFLDNYRYVNQVTVKKKLIELTQVNGNWTGGHLGEALFDSNREIYGILDATANVSTKTVGSRTYKQVRQTSITMKRTGSADRRKKDWHTWIEDITEQEYVEDISFAFMNKRQVKEKLTNNGTRQVYYKSKLKDGTNVTFTTEEPFYIDELDEVFSNHLTSILINPKF